MDYDVIESAYESTPGDDPLSKASFVASGVVGFAYGAATPQGEPLQTLTATGVGGGGAVFAEVAEAVM